MILNSYQINEALNLAPVAVEEAVEMSQRSDGKIWFDLLAPDPGDLEEWLERLAISGLSRRICLEAQDRPGFYPLKRELLLILPALADRGGQLERDYVGFLCRENLLLSFHRKAILNPGDLAALHESDDWLPDRSIAGLVSAMMIDLSQEGLRQNAQLRSAIQTLEERMDREPDRVEAEEILGLRSDLLILEGVVSDQIPCIHAMSGTAKPFFKLEGARDYMNCALTNLEAADRSLDRLNERIGALRAGFQMHAQDKTNRKLGMLTILSAIFMPITLLAGIWGMNFETMPELKFPFSYPTALCLMALIGLGMYLFFRRGGWFD